MIIVRILDATTLTGWQINSNLILFSLMSFSIGVLCSFFYMYKVQKSGEDRLRKSHELYFSKIFNGFDKLFFIKRVRLIASSNMFK